MTQQRKRVFGLDLIKALAILGVVCLHVAGMAFIGDHSQWSNHNYLSIVIYYLSTPAIPFFFLVNGYLILGRKEADYHYIGRKVIHMLIPVLTWNLLLVFGKLIIKHGKTDYLSTTLGSLIQKGFFFQFWFIGALIIVQLVVPVLHRLLNQQIKVYLFILGILLLTCLVFDIFNHVEHFPLQSKIIQTFRLWTWFLYYMVGGLIAKYHFVMQNYPHFKKYAYYFSLLSLLSLIYWIFNAGLIGNAYTEFNYDGFPCIFVATGIFVYFKTISEFKSKFVSNAVTLISQDTMGIFIVHVIVLKAVHKVVPSISTSSILNFISIFVIFFVSLIIVELLKRIPIVNRLFV